jgi:hypothetical protein
MSGSERHGAKRRAARRNLSIGIGCLVAVLLVVAVAFAAGRSDSTDSQTDDTEATTDARQVPPVSDPAPEGEIATIPAESTSAPATSPPDSEPPAATSAPATSPTGESLPSVESAVVQVTTQEIQEAGTAGTQGILVPGKAVCGRTDAISGGESYYTCEPLPDQPLLERECAMVAAIGDALEQGVGPITYTGLSKQLVTLVSSNPTRELEITGPEPDVSFGASLVRDGGAVVPLLVWADTFASFVGAGGGTDSVSSNPYETARTALEAACNMSLPSRSPNLSIATSGYVFVEEDLIALVSDPIYPHLPISAGDNSEGVRLLQESLNELSLASGDSDLSVGVSGADGRFGSDTERAVLSLQRGDGVEPTGVVDDLTLYWLRFRQLCFDCGRD